MIHKVSNNIPVIIDPGSPSVINSSIEVSGIPGAIRDVNVTIDVDHTWTNDLEISLVGPDGQRVLLVGREGGSGDNFRDTTFSDEATDPIVGAAAPFQGTFSPEENLAVFDNLDPNGTWTLHVEDRAFQDGGSLNSWSLTIETGVFEFHNDTPVIIDPGPANTVQSSLEVSGMGGSVIDSLTVKVDIDHTWDNDLTITLIGPDDTQVVLVDREGGREDNFKGTTFDDEAELSITEAAAPFSGTFRPEGSLSAFDNLAASGTWTLQIRDRASQDGGTLNRWSLAIVTKNAVPPVESAFNIQVRFLGGLTANQRSVFELAAARWAEIIVGDLPDVMVDGQVIDDVIIDAQGTPIDGPGQVLGQAGPTALRPGTFLPASGIMSFDTADLERMEADQSLVRVIIHEMGHVLGIGTIWKQLGLLQGAGTDDPVFMGGNAMREYGNLIGTGVPTPVPVANTGGQGTRDGHWREAVLGNELMTGFLGQGLNPLSRLTIAAFQDMGYEVNYDAADPFTLPSAIELAAMGVADEPEGHGDHGIMTFPEPIVLPDSALDIN